MQYDNNEFKVEYQSVKQNCLQVKACEKCTTLSGDDSCPVCKENKLHGVHEGANKVLFRTVMDITKTFLLICGIMITMSTAAVSISDAGETLKIGGTGSGLRVMKLLGEAYEKKNPGTKVQVMPNLGSAGGIRGVGKRALDIGISARSLKDNEKDYKLSLVEYARTPFVIVVRRDVAVSDLKMEDLVQIYDGRTQTWPDGRRIRPVVRPAEDIDTQIAKKMSPVMEKAVETAMSRQGVLTAVTDQEATNTIERTPGAIGFSTLGQITSEKLPLKILSLDGVSPTIRTLSNGSYKPYKVLILVTNSEPSAEVREFLRFIASAAGKKIFKESGYLVTLPKNGQ